MTEHSPNQANSKRRLLQILRSLVIEKQREELLLRQQRKHQNSSI